MLKLSDTCALLGCDPSALNLSGVAQRRAADDRLMGEVPGLCIPFFLSSCSFKFYFNSEKLAVAKNPQNSNVSDLFSILCYHSEN